MHEAAKENAKVSLEVEKLDLPESVEPIPSEQPEQSEQSEPESPVPLAWVRQDPEKTPSQVGVYELILLEHELKNKAFCVKSSLIESPDVSSFNLD